MRAWAILLLFFLLTGCNSTNAKSIARPTLSAEQSAPTTDPQVQFWQAWQTSPHANTYDLGKGPNTYCARCHSPRNWDPQAIIDPPPNCVSCKFSFEASPRLAQNNPLVPQEEWQNIRCNTCHEVTDGIASNAVVWWNQATNQYEPVDDSRALCGKCHTDTETLRHQRTLGLKAHADFTCTTCHDAHNTTASCGQSECHSEIVQNTGFVSAPATPPGGHPEQITGFCGGPACHATATQVAGGEQMIHGSVHAMVTCVACHDAGGLEVGPFENIWTTWRTTELLGRANREPYQSHTLQKQVDCARCHFEGNPWGLQPLTNSPEASQP